VGQGFVLTKQVLYCLSHRSSPFCSGCFGDGGLTNYSPGLTSNLDPLDLSLTNSQDYTYESLVPGSSILLAEGRKVCINSYSGLGILLSVQSFRDTGGVVMGLTGSAAGLSTPGCTSLTLAALNWSRLQLSQERL
jgi:hypothetical protein